jgi:hypothetical protein
MPSPFVLPDDIGFYIFNNMKRTKRAIAMLEEMGKIERMERGKLCKMKGREHFNHQTWQNGRNHVHYVPREDVEDLRHAISGYTRFIALAEQYADEIICATRREHARLHPRPPRQTTASTRVRKKSPRKASD